MRTAALIVLALVFTISFVVVFFVMSLGAADNNLHIGVAGYALPVVIGALMCFAWYATLRRLPATGEQIYIVVGYLIAALALFALMY